MPKEKILIVNAIPLNNGDAALVFSLYKKLQDKGHHVKIATYHFEEVIKQYPEYPFVKELGNHFIFKKLPFLKYILLPILFYFSKAHREAAIIIGAPGGYVNSNYRIKSSLQVFEIAKKYHKKTAIYAQSVGPLNRKDAGYFSSLMHHSIDYLMVRDSYSLNMVKNLNIDQDKYSITKDAAFLSKNTRQYTTASNTVAISVREWDFDNRNRLQYLNLVRALTEKLIDTGFKITFLSTCQGIDSYKNDALLADELIQSCTAKYREHIELDSDYYTFESFYNRLSSFKFVIGTRLHMCILAMTQQIPAFNISYEIKGKETYNYLGLANYSIDYNEDIEASLIKLQDFIDSFAETKAYLATKIPEIHEEVTQDFEAFYSNMKIH